MTFEELAIGWREALLGVIALLAIYVFVAFRRLRRLKPEETADAVPPAPLVETGAASLSAPLAESAPLPPPARFAESFPWNEPPDPAAPAPFDDSRWRLAEGELAQLRAEVAQLRGELAALREEVKQKVERVQAQHVVPIYGDAMQMAVAGYDALTIAERCGVARAEAELVVALVRNRDDSEPTMREQ